MTERPILFSGPMVRALLDGRKTQTRRIVKAQPPVEAVSAGVIGSGNPEANGLWLWLDSTDIEWGSQIGDDFRCPYGVPGDVLWVREGHLICDTHGQRRADGQRWGPWGGLPTRFNPDRTKIAYFREGFDRCDPGRWRPSIHMPRWASRLTLDITEVRVARLQDISEGDALAEGLFDWTYLDCDGDPRLDGHRFEARGFDWKPVTDPLGGHDSAAAAYRDLWEHINGKGSWAANPWVWVVTFEVRA